MKGEAQMLEILAAYLLGVVTVPAILWVVSIPIGAKLRALVRTVQD